MRYSDDELQVMKNIFAEDDTALKIIRKVIYQIPLTDTENATRETLFTQPEIMRIVRKCLLPEIDGNAPMLQVVDLWSTVNVREYNPSQAYFYIQAKELVIKYLNQQLNILERGGVGEIRFDSFIRGTSGDPEDKYIALLARQEILQHTEVHLAEMLGLAGEKNETPEQTKQRLEKMRRNSNK